jgi:hypothetical protein
MKLTNERKNRVYRNTSTDDKSTPNISTDDKSTPNISTPNISTPNKSTHLLAEFYNIDPHCIDFLQHRPP